MQTSPISARVKGVSVVIGAGKMGYVHEINAQTGKLIWKTPVGEHNGHDNDSLLALEHDQGALHDPSGSLGGVLTNLAAARGPRARREPSGAAAAGGCGRLSGVASGPAQAAERRRRRFGEDERRGQIIRGCVEVLACEGYRNASLARIAQAAGVSKGLVSHYFSDKETLMEQTAIATVAYLRAEVASAIDLTAEVPDVINAAVHYASQLRRAIPASCARSIRSPPTSVARTAPRDSICAPRGHLQGPRATLPARPAGGSLRDFDTRVMAVTYQGAVER